MTAMNKQLNLKELQATTQNFQKETAKMDMTEEMCMLCWIYCTMLIQWFFTLQDNSYSHYWFNINKFCVIIWFLVIVNDTLEGVLDGSGDEEEQDAIISQVLDEIGIETSGKVSNIHNIIIVIVNYLCNYLRAVFNNNQGFSSCDINFIIFTEVLRSY